MSAVKVFKKGETLYKEGEKAQSVFLIQSGAVSLQFTRQKAHIDLCTLGSNQIAGEHALSGVLTHPHTAVCTAETKAVELPVDGLKGQLEGGTQIVKFVSKALSDKLKLIMKEFSSMKLANDPSPCPPEQTAKIFGTLYHVARTKGETQKDGVIKVPWPLMKQYAQRVFLESPKRLENAMNIFVKIGTAKIEMVKNEIEPDGPDEIGFIHFSDLSLIEQFFEFYQYYYFKGGKMELLRTDERIMMLASALLEAAKDVQQDRHGAVRMDYTVLVEKVKTLTGIQLNNDLFTVMENKGLFVKRQQTDNGVFLQFDYKEFDRTTRVWKVLKEVERWNEKGHVDPNEPLFDPKKAAKPGQLECPACHHPYDGTPKFCAECGHKLQPAAAA